MTDVVKEAKKFRASDIIKVIVLTLIIIWVICFFVDYFRARQSKNPIFCIKEVTKEYDDGTVYSCTGLGYKMYRYDRSSVATDLEFGPFFIKEKTN